MLTSTRTYQGRCHCGAVRFRVAVPEDAREVLDCNCSICTKKGILHLIVDDARLEIIAGADQLTTYTFGTHVAKHMFCRTCGIHPFYRPRSHPQSWDVNVRCLDVPLEHWRIERFDGANWEDSVESIR
jgi:hypothetical protein